MLILSHFLSCLLLFMLTASDNLAEQSGTEHTHNLEQARHYLSQNKAEEALEITERLLANPGLPPARQAAAMEYYLEAMKELRRKNLPPARKAQAKVLADAAMEARRRMNIWWHLGVLVHNQGELAEARHYFEKALENLPPGDTESHYRLLMSIGVAQVQLGHYSEATESLLEAERIHDRAGMPPDYALYQNLSGLFYYLKDWDKAIQYVKKALAIVDENSVQYTWALSNLGDIYRHKKDYENAYRYLKATVDRTPDDPDGWLNLGCVLAEKQNHKEALSALNKALKLYQDHGTLRDLGLTHQSLGRVWSSLGDHEKAITHFRKALTLFDRQDSPPERLQLYKQLANELEQTGRYAEALALMKKHKSLHEELLNAETKARIAELKSLAELEKKKRTLATLEQKRALDRQTIVRLELQATHDRILRWFLVTGLILTSLIMLLLMGMVRMRQRLHQELSAQHRDIEELNHKLWESSIRDPLTGLYNRRYITQEVEALTTRRKADGANGKQSPALVVLADLDQFKQINDTWGHSVGDQALKIFAETFSRSARKGDIPVRWGGEEFLLFCRDMDIRQGIKLCARIRRQLHDLEIQADGTTLRITCSFGIAPLPLHPDLPPRWSWTIKLADAALYTAKSMGRDCWAAYALREIPSWLEDDDLDISRLRSEGLLQEHKAKTGGQEACD